MNAFTPNVCARVLIRNGSFTPDYSEECGNYSFYCRYQCWRRSLSADVKQTIIRFLLSDRDVRVRDGDEEVLSLAITRITYTDMGAIRIMSILTHIVNRANKKGRSGRGYRIEYFSFEFLRTFSILQSGKSRRKESLQQEKTHRTLTFFSGLKSNLTLT